MKPFALIVTLVCGLLAVYTPASAQIAVYRDGKLSIPAGVVLNSSGQFYYKEIVLQADSAGKLQVLAASLRPLTYVDSVTPAVVETTDSRSVTLRIAGNRSVPCVGLEPAAVTRKDAEFTVLLAETVMGPAESCIAVLAPFEISVSLDVTGLQAGSYKVSVNDKQATFVLTKNPAAK